MIGLFLAIIAMVFAYYGWQDFRERRRQIAGSVAAIGSVIEIVPISINGRRLYSPKVAFATSQGQNVIFVSDYGASWKAFQINQRVEIFYNPQNPQQAGIKKDASAGLLAPLLMVIGGAVGIGGLIFAVFEIFIYFLILSKR